MSIPETQRELIAYLSTLTRSLHQGVYDRFTTTSIARALSISRNLASHYLNDMVRAGIAVKAGNRPVYYFHRRALERVFQMRLECTSFDSLDELLYRCGVGEARDFSQAIGSEASLAPCIECCKAAMKYPPYGLPLLLEGAPGVGKAYLAQLAFQFGRNSALLPEGSAFVTVECSAYASSGASMADVLCAPDGVYAQAAGGVVLFRDADRLTEAQAAELVTHLADDNATAGVRPRVMFTISDSAAPASVLLARCAPMRAVVPSYHARSAKEREQLVRHFFCREGGKLGVDVLVSRGALRLLVTADFADNVRGLRLCITTCCADAYLKRKQVQLVVNVWQLPTNVLGIHIDSQLDDGRLLNMAHQDAEAQEGSELQALDTLMNAFEAFRLGGSDWSDLERAVRSSMRDYGDALLFDDAAVNMHVSAYEWVMNDVLAGVGSAHNITFTHKEARLLARMTEAQLRPSAEFAAWNFANASELAQLVAVVAQNWRFASVVADQAMTSVHQALGMEHSALMHLMVAVLAREREGSARCRTSVGIVLSHGYATASSIADAANRVLGARVFEAIDMLYEQQITDIMDALRALLARYAYCAEVAILVDMGSLEQVDRDLGGITGFTLGVMNNISTGLAIEVGAGLLAGRSLADVLSAAAQACTCRYRVVEGTAREEAIIFCSEGGVNAAEKIKTLVTQSLEHDIAVRLVAYDAERLAANGRQDALFATYKPVAVVGTFDPHCEGVPFIPLEDLISNEVTALDAVLAPHMSAEELEGFHQNLFKTLTLRNVVESITILNPTRLLEEIEQAVGRLEDLLGVHVAERVKMGLYVHLCCLVERLVTHVPIGSYANERAFTEQHRDFIAVFQRSFSDIAERYSVEVPIAEIAYVYDYIQAPRPKRLQAHTEVGEDE